MKEKSTENFSDQKNHSSNDIAINPAVDESFLNTPFAALPNSALADQSSTQADVELNELQRLRLVPPTIQELEANDFALIKAAAKKQKILDFYYSIAIEDCSRIPWFHWAALCNQIETIKVHLNEGGNSLCIDLQNRTPAMLAVEIGHLELFEVLLYDKNYNFSQRDIKGNTLANYMVKNNRLDCIESLLSYIDFHHQQRINPQKSTEEQLYYKNLAGEAAYTFIKVLYLASYDDKNLELFKILLSMYRNMLQKETGKAPDEAAAKIAFSHIVNKLAYRAAYYNQLAILDYLIEEQLINTPPEFERSNSSVFSQFLQQLKLRHVIDNFKSLEKEFEPAVKRVLPPAYWQDFINRLDYLRQLINDTLEDESLKMPILSYLDQSEAHANQLIVLNNDQSDYDKYKNYLRSALDKLWQAGYQLEITLDIQEGRRPRQINNYTLKQVPSLPTEVWLSILALTDSTSLVNIQKVDHMLDQVSQDDYIWKNLFINFFPEEQPDEAADGISWKETFKTHYLEQYGSANRRTKKLISLIIRGDLDALKSCEISSRDLLVDNFLLLKTAARANNQTALDYFYSLVFTETMRSREDLGALTPEIRNQQEVFLFFWAALCNQRETIRLNLEHTPAAIDWSEHQGRTITMLAAEIGHVRLFQDLLRRPNSSKNRLLAPYVAKNGSRDLFLTLVSPDYEHGDIDQASGFDWNKSSRRFRIIVPEVLRHAAQYGQINLIRFMLESQAVDFKSALNATIEADNVPLLRKLRAL
ncbi:ankyrin repeat domain-containing protein, partial [Legionella sp.]|uniref:ankyrin repeat domain-containing protein n=1 Tax=Legionella sp. TaxID=459 RepID=UPI000CBF1B25